MPKKKTTEEFKEQLCQEHGIKILYVVKEEDLAKCFKKKFLGLYNDDNVIEEDKLDKIQNILNS